eukprot:1269871-Prymnesium_polylepis.1
MASYSCVRRIDMKYPVSAVMCSARADSPNGRNAFSGTPIRHRDRSWSLPQVPPDLSRWRMGVPEKAWGWRRSHKNDIFDDKATSYMHDVSIASPSRFSWQVGWARAGESVRLRCRSVVTLHAARVHAGAVIA